jgi:hypothetical protein
MQLTNLTHRTHITLHSNNSMYIQNVPEINTENLRVSTMAQNNKNVLYKLGSENASIIN